MSEIVIKAEGLGKKYLIGHQSERERYTALRDVVVRNVKGVLNKTRQVLSGQQLLAGDEIEEFWALKDIDFEIKRGDRVGIIGRNGAGKSTLLKVLSRITEPSTGRVEIHGRVASLLEVGTGFHPELTGRENIFLNGAILGMTRAEIKKKFDEIVDFAGVEKFLDTPVKRYSSGMYVRLAFAVAAHLEPEILVVDEVLAVGDAEFQKKCLGKMEDVSKNEGRTVLFVSHNISSLMHLCNTGILLEKGQMVIQDKADIAIKKYLRSRQVNNKNICNEIRLNENLTINYFDLNEEDYKLGESIIINLKVTFLGILKDLSLLFYNEMNERVAILDLRNNEVVGKKEVLQMLAVMSNNRFIEGKYFVGIFCSTTVFSENIFELLSFNIIGNDSKHFLDYSRDVRGYFEPELSNLKIS